MRMLMRLFIGVICSASQIGGASVYPSTPQPADSHLTYGSKSNTILQKHARHPTQSFTELLVLSGLTPSLPNSNRAPPLRLRLCIHRRLEPSPPLAPPTGHLSANAPPPSSCHPPLDAAYNGQRPRSSAPPPLAHPIQTLPPSSRASRRTYARDTRFFCPLYTRVPS